MNRPTSKLIDRVNTPVLMACAWVLCTPLAALAQDAAELRPPNPGNIKGPLGVLVVIVLALLAGLLILAAAFPSKRGHQD